MHLLQFAPQCQTVALLARRGTAEATTVAHGRFACRMKKGCCWVGWSLWSVRSGGNVVSSIDSDVVVSEACRVGWNWFSCRGGEQRNSERGADLGGQAERPTNQSTISQRNVKSTHVHRTTPCVRTQPQPPVLLRLATGMQWALAHWERATTRRTHRCTRRVHDGGCRSLPCHPLPPSVRAPCCCAAAAAVLLCGLTDRRPCANDAN
jgi:hypothetical protein